MCRDATFSKTTVCGGQKCIFKIGEGIVIVKHPQKSAGISHRRAIPSKCQRPISWGCSHYSKRLEVAWDKHRLWQIERNVFITSNFASGNPKTCRCPVVSAFLLLKLPVHRYYMLPVNAPAAYLAFLSAQCLLFMTSFSAPSFLLFFWQIWPGCVVFPIPITLHLFYFTKDRGVKQYVVKTPVCTQKDTLLSTKSSTSKTVRFGKKNIWFT